MAGNQGRRTRNQERHVAIAVEPAALDQLFRTARTYNEWSDTPVDERVVREDGGPMSGFDNAAVDQEFFAGTRIQSNFICSLGYGKPNSPFPRNPRLTFEEAGQFA